MKSSFLSSERFGLCRSVFLIVLLLGGSVSSYGQFTKTVGTGGDYTTLSMAFDSINAGAITGNLVLKLISNSIEPSSAILNASGTGNANYSSVLIKPDTGQTIVVTGNVAATGLLLFNGTSNLTIDGSNHADGLRNLTIVNTSNTGHVLQFQNGASDNIIKNTILKGAGSAGQGVIYFSTTTTTGNSNNTIENNEITKGSGSVSYGILNNGTATGSGTFNTNDTIRANLIHDFDETGIIDKGGSAGFIYADNEIYNTSAATASAVGFKCASLNIHGFTFIRNYIYGLTGSSMSVPGGCGIYLNDVSPSTTCVVANNRIVLNPENINNTLYGIYDAASVNTLPYEIVYNTVVISGTSNAGGNSNTAPYVRMRNSLTKLYNNILVNTRTGGTGYHSVIFLANTGLTSNLSSDYNDLFNPNTSSFSNIVNNNHSLLSFSGWKAFLKDQHSVIVNPMFVSPYSDLHISGSNCMLDGKGTPITVSAGFSMTVTDDFENDPRNDSLPDMGADEFTGVSLTPPILTLSNDTIKSTPAVYYQWYRNGAMIPGATDSIYILKGDGSYTLLISDSNGCSAFGNDILITLLNELKEEHLMIYPNPATNECWISGTAYGIDEGERTIELMNTFGEKVYHSRISSGNSSFSIFIDTAPLHSGVYVLSVCSSKGVQIKKISIQK